MMVLRCKLCCLLRFFIFAVCTALLVDGEKRIVKKVRDDVTDIAFLRGEAMGPIPATRVK